MLHRAATGPDPLVLGDQGGQASCQHQSWGPDCSTRSYAVWVSTTTGPPLLRTRGWTRSHPLPGCLQPVRSPTGGQNTPRPPGHWLGWHGNHHHHHDPIQTGRTSVQWRSRVREGAQQRGNWSPGEEASVPGQSRTAEPERQPHPSSAPQQWDSGSGQTLGRPTQGSPATGRK